MQILHSRKIIIELQHRLTQSIASILVELCQQIPPNQIQDDSHSILYGDIAFLASCGTYNKLVLVVSTTLFISVLTEI
jgi:hypothetical protein